jgi:putative oxidoreductase
MRLVVGSALVDHGILGFRGETTLEAVIVGVLTTGTGILFLAGLWTPFAGTLGAAVELWCAFSQPSDPLIHLLLLTMGVVLALVGPGAWSVDARLFGWKRIDIRSRRN